jgi:hypothetical protein
MYMKFFSKAFFSGVLASMALFGLPLVAAAPGPPYACVGTPTMQEGLSNPGLCVQTAQWYLNKKATPSPGLAEDGNFTAAVTTAVKAWQTSKGLAADGIIGPKTWSSFTCVNWDNAAGACKDVVTPGPTTTTASANCSQLEKNFTDFGGGTPGPLANNCYSPGQAVAKATNLGFTLVGILAVLAIVIGGYRYMTSAGDEKRAGAGKKTIMWALIGLVLVFLAYAIVTITTRLTTTNSLF